MRRLGTPGIARLCAVLFAGIVLAGGAQAQDAVTVDGVTVTATRVERPSLDIPAAVDRVRAEDIRFARPQVNLSESLGRVPGIAVQNRENYAQDLQVTSRGFGTRATFGIRGLRLIADGIPASMPDGQGQAANFDLGTAERIEILRGPFSVMHGNAAGGVINIVTGSGGREPGVAADAAAGSYGMRRGALRAGDKLGGFDWNAGASRFQTDGYREHSKARREQLNAKLGYAPGDATSIVVVVNAFDSPDTQDPLGLTRVQMESDPRQAGTNALAFDTRKSARQTQAGVTLAQRLSSTDTLDAALYSGRRAVRQYQAIPLNIQTASATHPGAVIDLERGYGGASLRLTDRSTLAGRPLTVIVGGEYERMAERRRGYLNNNGAAGALRRDEDDVVRATGIYAQAEWRFAEQWIALGGLRANRVAFSSTDTYIVPGNPDDSGAKSYRETTPVAGLVWRLAPATSLYANTGRGFETPTFAELAYRPGGATGLNFALEPSRSRHAEFGIKTAIGAARINAALFDVQTRDEIVVESSAGGRSTFRNAGRTQRRGAEVGAGAELPLGFDATLAWTRLDARFVDAYTTTGGTVAAGNVLPGVPRDTLWAELRWRHAASGFTAALDALRKSRAAVDDRNTDTAAGYTVANVALGFVQQGARWRISEYLRIDNLTDRRYAGSVIVNEANLRFFEPAPGRNATLGVQAWLAF